MTERDRFAADPAPRRRAVSILPWDAADPPVRGSRAADRRSRAGRPPVPPSRLIAAPEVTAPAAPVPDNCPAAPVPDDRPAAPAGPAAPLPRSAADGLDELAIQPAWLPPVHRTGSGGRAGAAAAPRPGRTARRARPPASRAERIGGQVTGQQVTEPLARYAGPSSAPRPAVPEPKGHPGPTVFANRAGDTEPRGRTEPPGRTTQPERTEQSDHAGRTTQPERTGRATRSERAVQSERPEPAPPPTASPTTASPPAASPPAAAPATAEGARATPLTAAAISHERVVRAEPPVPRRGWRAALYASTGGRVNVGVAPAERAHQELLRRVRRPLVGSRHIAVASIKGGVGKTTVAACLGLMLAEYRGDGVVAVDADPDAGTLADRLAGGPPPRASGGTATATAAGTAATAAGRTAGTASATVRDLLADLESVGTLGDVGRYTALAGRLRVLAGEQDPAMGAAFRREEYLRVCTALARFFPIVITDSGTGLVHSAMRGTLELADRLIVVGTPTVDGASRASKTLDWLLAHGHGDLVADAVLVLCQDRSSPKVDDRQLSRHFAQRCRHVVRIPADPHLYSGGRIDPDALRPATRDACLELAAVIADGFALSTGAVAG